MWAAPVLNSLFMHPYPTILSLHSSRQSPSFSFSTKPGLAGSSKAPVTMETTSSWDQVLGSSNWEGLLDPLDLSLRQLIIRCGDFCQATYDSFINDQNSRYCGCRFGKKSLFEKVMLIGASDYEVAAYLYATARVSFPEAFMVHSRSRESWDRESNWIGYVAATTDEISRARGRREIYVAWRGTTRDYEWIDVGGLELTSAKELLRPQQGVRDEKDGSSSSDSNDEDDEKSVQVMLGWLTIYTSDDPRSPFNKASARQQFQSHIKRLMNKYKDEKVSVIVTGHSLGASLAVLSSFDIVENQLVPSHVTVSAIIFGCPRVGNRAFNEQIKQHPNLHILHVKNTIDLITHYPSRILGYVNTGTELVIDTRKSPYLKDSKNTGDWHNLMAMVHVVSGWNGDKGEFEQKVERSLALVNKSCDFLKADCLVPASWWVEKNKGMIRKEDGEWVTESPAEADLPVPSVLDF